MLPGARRADFFRAARVSGSSPASHGACPESLRGVIRSALLALCLVAGSSPDVHAFDRAAWHGKGWTTQFESGVAAARAASKPAFVYFDAVWCSWCQQYQRDVLEHSAVRTRLAKDFVRIVVDYDARPDLMRRFGGKGLPFTVVFSPDGVARTRFVGVMPARDLLAHLDTFVVQPQGSAEALSPDEVLHRVGALDRPAYDAFRAAYLKHVDALYDPARETLVGQFDTGLSFRRTPLLAWLYLGTVDGWEARARRAARADRARLWDAAGSGFFNFVDPSRGEYLESSKLLEVNAWMAARQAQVAQTDTEAGAIARATERYLAAVLWDPARGGFWQAQNADNAYYAASAAQRARRTPPAVDRVKRADTNAQAVWALVLTGRALNNPRTLDTAAATMDFILRDMRRDGRLHHAWRDGRASVTGVPQTWFWVLAAGSELERARPDAARRAQLRAIGQEAARWVRALMRDARAKPLDTELAGLVAFVAGRGIAGLPPQTEAWALRQLRIESETSPDAPVIGLWAWEARLAAERGGAEAAAGRRVR